MFKPEFMKAIMEELENIERLKGIKILHACETGSRAWGFPSPDSDYDVRFIYRHERDWYLHLGQRKDTVDLMSGQLDITGWDLRKSLVLIKKSNAALIERFQSPVLYRAEHEFRNDFLQLIAGYYSAKAVYYHHYSLAVKFWEELRGKKTFKLKSYFYLLRSLLSCNWILSDSSVPPMHIEGLMKYVSEHDCEMIRELIRLKSGVNESYMHESANDERRLAEELFKIVGNKGDTLPVGQEDYSRLNNFFIKQLYETNNK